MKKEFNKLFEILKEFNIDDVKEIEERLDKQYLALQNLYKNIKDPLLFLKLVLINSLLSYQLSMKGEDYWQRFSEFFSIKNKTEYFEEFLKKYNKRFLNSKLKRLNKLRSFFEKLSLKEFDFFVESPHLYLQTLSNFLNQKKEDKTIVFSLKMLYYAYRIIKNEFKPFPKGVMIPLDNRIKKISNNKEFWKSFERAIEFSLLHIDSIIWVTKGLKKEEIKKIRNESLKNKIKKLKEILG